MAGESWTGIDALNEHIAEQARFLVDTTPAYHRLLGLVSDALEGPLAERLQAAWAGRRFHSRYERPLLLQAALRDAALNDGAGHPLYAGVVDPGAADAVTKDALAASLDDPRVWTSLTSRFVQTNETTRAVAWLWLRELIAEHHPSAQEARGATLSLNDVGASAGLNLVGDRLERPWTRRNGEALLRDDDSAPGYAPLRVVERRGFDPSPLDATRAEDARWLTACVWPGRHTRLQRLSRAIAQCTRLAAEGQPIELHRARAVDVPERLGTAGTFAIAVQTIVRDYIPPDEKHLYVVDMRRWLAARPGRNYWVELELPGDDAPPERYAALDVHTFHDTDVATYRLARCHPHPSVLDVDDHAVRALTDALRQRDRKASRLP